MTIKTITELTIFESPDGGRTVYARQPGNKARELHLRDPLLEQEIADIEKQKRWMEIFNLRRENIMLNELCEQAEILFELSKTTK